MRICHVSFNGVRGLSGRTFNLPRTRDTDLVVVYGPPASGKTGLLDTLAAVKERIADYGAPDGRWDSLVASGASAKIKIQWDANDDERTRFGIQDNLLSTEVVLGHAAGVARHPVALQGILSQPGSATQGSVHYLHDTRDLEGPQSFPSDDGGLRLRLTTRNGKFSHLYDMLDQPEYGPQKRLATDRLLELCPQLELVGLRRVGTSFYTRLRDVRTNEERRYDSLSMSERQAMILALYTSFSPIVESVVLVDTPELGFGDAAVAYLQALLRWTTRTQIIAATGVSAVRAMAEVAHVIELVS